MVVAISCCISDENISNGSANVSAFDEGKSMDEKDKGAIYAILNIFNIIMDFLGFDIALVNSGGDMLNKVERNPSMVLNIPTSTFILTLRSEWIVQQQQ